MNKLINFPHKAYFGKTISKSKIYQKAGPNSRTKEYFIRQIENMIWAYKLSPKTTNLPADEKVKEIQIIEITLREKNLNQMVLLTIDKAIPSPVIFILFFKQKTRYMAAYKRPGEADKNKWVIRSGYFVGSWLDESTQQVNLPTAISLSGLYFALLKKISNLKSDKNENIADFVERADSLKSLKSEKTKLQSRVTKEKQFNRKVELNSKLNRIKAKIGQLENYARY